MSDLYFRWTNMVVFTLEKRWEILWHCFENHGNVEECVRKLCRDFERRKALSTPHVLYLAKKVKETGIHIDKPKGEKPKIIMRTPENIVDVAENVQFTVALSNWIFRWYYCDEFCIKLATTPYKVQLVQELKPIDHPMCFHFVKWSCDRLTENADFGKKLSFQMKLILLLAVIVVAVV